MQSPLTQETSWSSYIVEIDKVSIADTRDQKKAVSEGKIDRKIKKSEIETNLVKSEGSLIRRWCSSSQHLTEARKPIFTDFMVMVLYASFRALRLTKSCLLRLLSFHPIQV